MTDRTFTFDRDYYRRYYGDRATRVESGQERTLRGNFVAAYLRYLGQPVSAALDLGCGLGYWKRLVHRHFPGASYLGVEHSEYLCERYGWERGSAADFRSRRRFNLVICQDVLQYLAASQAERAIENLARLCRGAMFFQVMTREDWEDNCDQARTDGNVYRRPATWYRRRLREHFVNAGGGLFVSRRATVVMYALECALP